MNSRDVGAFCKVVAKACSDGKIPLNTAKSIIGQAKRGDLAGAIKGLGTALEKGRK